MSYTASFEKFPLRFKKPAGTSRGFLLEKPSWLIKIKDSDLQTEGIGECSIIPGLSIDDPELIEKRLESLCQNINKDQNLEPDDDFQSFPAIKFALETAILDLKGGAKKILFNNSFSRGETGIPINGLIWMAGFEDMLSQAKDKIENGYHTLKFKIGAIDFETEIRLIQAVRNNFGPDIEIRLDANGAFTESDVLQKLERLSNFRIHSIEQPVKPGNTELIHQICIESPIPVALDEELIGVQGYHQKIELLQAIQPHFIILKPSLLGGLAMADEWIEMADSNHIGWWATSALESNIGLNAIAQWVAGKDISIPQGLGTGGLYIHNFPMPLKTLNGKLWFT